MKTCEIYKVSPRRCRRVATIERKTASGATIFLCYDCENAHGRTISGEDAKRSKLVVRERESLRRTMSERTIVTQYDVETPVGVVTCQTTADVAKLVDDFKLPVESHTLHTYVVKCNGRQIRMHVLTESGNYRAHDEDHAIRLAKSDVACLGSDWDAARERGKWTATRID